MAGISRSTTLVTAYIMTVTEMDWTEILKSIKCSRPITNPNAGFQRQLKEFDQSEKVKVVGLGVSKIIALLSNQLAT